LRFPPKKIGMENANRILESLNATEISDRLDDLEREREALRVLYRAAVRLERQQKPAANASKASPSSRRRGKR
jgi:hypothetical protein